MIISNFMKPVSLLLLLLLKKFFKQSLLIFYLIFLLNPNLPSNHIFVNSFLYNTTSGIYEARLVKIYNYAKNDNSYSYVHKILNIPYAEKPERFQQSILKKYQYGIHRSREQISCYQSVNVSAYGLFNLHEPPKMTEDCLTISLYIPVASTNELECNKKYKNMSVVMHIHGGSNAVGSSALFDGSIMASHGNVIVVLINYRLSILGFLSDMTKKYPGNYALRDQLLAIKWLRMNCDVFNCNPNSITLWGHSAGASDVNWLAMSPLSNKLFKRVIIQSGSAFAYWGFDKMAHERYKSLKIYFNCTNLPDVFTPENKAMTMLIEDCLMKVSLDDLFSFKFALIDAPGPTYDGFLGKEESLISEESVQEMMNKHDNILNLDILTGINTVEGFSFEGYFSSSVKFWSKNNFTDELTVTFERFALLGRDKCKTNSMISNRLLMEQFYQDKIESLVLDKKYLQYDEVKRLKTIFANSHIIFDSGFVEFIKRLSEKMAKHHKKSGNLFVYEYLHENSGSQSFLNKFKNYVNENFYMSTHFDGIDLAFGLPIAFHLEERRRKTLNNMNESFYNYEIPFSNFAFDSLFDLEDAKLSSILITYLTNFIKNGDPNIGETTNYNWASYLENKSYLKVNSDLLESNVNKTVKSTGVRDDLFHFWFNETLTDDCSMKKSEKTYEGRNHSNGTKPSLDKCFEKLDESKEYVYLSEMFLIEYERCMATVEHNITFRNFFNTICLDAIAIRRLLIEYDICCKNNDSSITSTICSFKDFNKKFVNFNLNNLINFTKSSSTVSIYARSDSSFFNSLLRIKFFYFIIFNVLIFKKYF